MKINRNRFCINRKVAPGLKIADFMATVYDLGLTKIEVRNDIEQELPNGSITGDLSINDFNKLVAKYNLEVMTINAIYPFNIASKREADTIFEVATKQAKIAKDINCHGLALCPHVSINDTRSQTAKDQSTVDALKKFADVLNKYDLIGFVEPLGFGSSTLRFPWEAQRLIKESGADCFKITLDTFHHHLASISDQDIANKLDINKVGMVQVSGVEDTRPTDQLTDEERIMLTDKDVMRNYEQVKNLEKIGYTGVYSFEPFSTLLRNWDRDTIKTAINHSIEFFNK